MWWGSWPEHVRGFWEWAQSRSNVLFFHFEDLKEDLSATVRRVADFLECLLSAKQISAVLHKCSFRYMKEHEESFEMSPPTLFTYRQTFFKSGSSWRHTSLDLHRSERILDFCQAHIGDSTYPLSRYLMEVKRSHSD